MLLLYRICGGLFLVMGAALLGTGLTFSFYHLLHKEPKKAEIFISTTITGILALLTGMHLLFYSPITFL